MKFWKCLTKSFDRFDDIVENKWILCGAILLCLLALFSFPINSKNLWFHYESLSYVSHFNQIHRTDKSLPELFFDLQSLNDWPRPTRVLGNLFLAADSLLRPYLWKIFPVHASLSLHWLLTLFLSLFLFWKIGPRIGLSQFERICLWILFVNSIGTLSNLANFFRSSKPVANILMLAFILIALNPKSCHKRSQRGSRVFYLLHIFWGILLLIDETMFLTLVLFPLLGKKHYRSISDSAALALVPLTAVIMSLFIVPSLVNFYGHGWPNLLEYKHVTDSSFLLMFTELPGFLRHSLADSLGLFLPLSFSSSSLILVFYSLIAAKTYLLARRSKHYSQLIKVALLCFFVSVAFSSLHMSSKFSASYIYWYGSHISLASSFVLILALKSFKSNTLTLFCTIVICVLTGTKFESLNKHYRFLNSYQLHLVDIPDWMKEVDELHRTQNHIKLFDYDAYGKLPHSSHRLLKNMSAKDWEVFREIDTSFIGLEMNALNSQ